jgi:hypothetical protein
MSLGVHSGAGVRRSLLNLELLGTELFEPGAIVESSAILAAVKAVFSQDCLVLMIDRQKLTL